VDAAYAGTHASRTAAGGIIGPMDPRVERAIAASALLVSGPAIAFIDLATGLEVSFSIFYVIPPVAAGWYLGGRLGVLVALVTGLSWAYAESVTRPASLTAALWNRTTRIAVLIAFTYLIDLVRRNQQELRRLLVQRDEFLSLVAHELRAPVAAIEIVATGIASTQELAEPARHALQQMREQARGLTSLAEGLLSVGRLEAHPRASDRESVDLRALVLSLAERGPRVVVTAPMSPVVVEADTDVIRRALLNVVENALKFSEPAQPVEVDLWAEHGHARVRVVDHGIGLDPTEIPRLFGKYSRLRSARSFTGIGLGLYYAQLAVQAHGGAISAHSAGPGHGATFDVQLPLAQQPLAESASRD
jgi:signal transduction histidine kinase